MVSSLNTKIPPRGTPQSTQAEAFIRLRGVKKAYKTAAGDFFALNGVDVDLHAGEFVGILGKSGAGKTTLVNRSRQWIISPPVRSGLAIQPCII